jgi:hypothetical protein
VLLVATKFEAVTVVAVRFGRSNTPVRAKLMPVALAKVMSAKLETP